MTSTLNIRRMMTAGVALAAVALLSACAATAGSGGQSDSVGPARDQLIGRWVPTEDGASPNAFIQFEDDGTLTNSDGCNGAEGTWSLEGPASPPRPGRTRRCTATAMSTPTPGCTRHAPSRWRTVSLVLLGDDGSTVGRLTPDTTDAMPDRARVSATAARSPSRPPPRS